MCLLLFFIVFWRTFKLRSSNFLNAQLKLGKAELCFLQAFEPSSSMQVEVMLLILGDNWIKDICMRSTSCQTAMGLCFGLAWNMSPDFA